MQISKRSWILPSVAASLMVGPTLFLLPGMQGVLLGTWIVVVVGISAWQAQRIGALGKLPDFIHDLLDGDELCLERRCEPDNPVAIQLNRFLAASDEQVIDISRSASRLVPIARELADSYKMIHQKSQMQNQYGNAVAVSVRELDGMREQVHTQNQEISEVVNASVQGADAALATVQLTAGSMQTLAESTDAAAQQIDVLANVNTEILSIAQTITEIADSTNLLALNAAIEAARAGEHGRGFAVVADEVRRLSAQTQAATANIRELADSVGSESEQTVAQIRLTRDSAVKTQEQMSKASAQLGEIASAVQQIKALSDAITTGMQQQEEMAISASRNVGELVELNESVVSENHSHAVSEADLFKLAETIRGKIGRFRLSECGWDESKRPQKKRAAVQTVSG